MTEKHISKLLKEQEKMEIFKTIIGALEKQMETAPICENLLAHCPTCRRVLAGKQNYCSKCGQRIRW